MFDIGWTELLVIGIVALIVVGPKDLPGMFRALGKFTARARSMARDFTRAMEEAADEAGVKDVTKTLKSATSAKNLGLDAVKKAATGFDDWDEITEQQAAEDKPKGPATQALSEERAEVAKKIREKAAEAANKRLAAEAAAAESSGSGGTQTAAAPKKAATRKAAPKQPAAAKTAAKKPAAKKPAAKKATATARKKASE